VFLTMTGRSLRDDSASAREGKTSEAAGDAAAAARG
jgi:hypothetical protein